MPDAAHILARYRAALSKGGKAPERVESIGTLHGASLRGIVHSWHDGDKDRTDQNLGARIERQLQLGDRRYMQNGSGDVIEYKGLLKQRGITQDFIGSTELFTHPQYVKVLGRDKLSDGREVYRVEVSPPGGESETLGFDVQSGLLDRLEYIDGDGVFTVDFSDYRPVHGYLFAFKQVQSDGTHAFDVTQTLTSVTTGQKIDPAIFKPFVPARLDAPGPVTVPIAERNGGIYTDVTIHGRKFSFLIDSGAQGVVLDSAAAVELALVPQGSFEARGTARMGGIGVTTLDKLHIGEATLPVGVVSILDLARSTDGRFAIDGILGYPLFGAGEVQIDMVRKKMTIAPPGTLPPNGTKFDIEVDRELPEIGARINGIDGKFLVDTGNGNELLLFKPFADANRGIIPQSLRAAVPSYGVGGATRAYWVSIDELDLGPYRLFHRYTSVIQSSEGAFADRFDAGNIGLAILKNFVFTVDAFNGTMYLAKSSDFNDGSARRPEEDPTHFH